MARIQQRHQALNQQAFSAGWRGFWVGDPEVYLRGDRSEIWTKEYTRGWEGAYFKKQKEC